MADTHELIIDQVGPGTLRLALDGEPSDTPMEGHVDNLLLTAVDKLLREHRIHKSAHVSAHAGVGVDKNSSLYRMVNTFAAALRAALQQQKGR